MGENCSSIKKCLFFCRNPDVFIDDFYEKDGRNSLYEKGVLLLDENCEMNARYQNSYNYYQNDQEHGYSTTKKKDIKTNNFLGDEDSRISPIRKVSSDIIYKRPTIKDDYFSLNSTYNVNLLSSSINSFAIASFRYKRLVFVYYKAIKDNKETVEYLEDLKNRNVNHIFRFGVNHKISRGLLKLNGITVDELKCKNGNIPEKVEINEWLNRVKNYIKSQKYPQCENKRVYINVEDDDEQAGMADLLICIILMEYDLNYSSALIKMVYHKSISLNLVQMILIERYKGNGSIYQDIEYILNTSSFCQMFCKR